MGFRSGQIGEADLIIGYNIRSSYAGKIHEQCRYHAGAVFTGKAVNQHSAVARSTASITAR